MKYNFLIASIRHTVRSLALSISAQNSEKLAWLHPLLNFCIELTFQLYYSSSWQNNEVIVSAYRVFIVCFKSIKEMSYICL